MIENTPPGLARMVAELNGKIDLVLAFLNTFKAEGEPSKLADVQTYCKRMNISRQTAYRHMKSGRVKFLRMGSTIRIDLNSIDKLFNKTKTQ